MLQSSYIFTIYRTRATITRSSILTIHKARILRKKPLEKTFLDFKKWVKSIQTAGYNGARTVYSRTVSSKRLLTALPNLMKLFLGHSDRAICTVHLIASFTSQEGTTKKELSTYCPNIYTVPFWLNHHSTNCSEVFSPVVTV